MIVFGLLLFDLVLSGTPFRLYSALILITYGVIAAIDATTSASRSRPLLRQGTISGLVGLFVLSVWFVGNVLAIEFPNPFKLDTISFDTIFRHWLLAARLVGAWAIFIGIIHIIAAIQLRWDAKNLWLMGASGVSLTIFGILLLPKPPYGEQYPWPLLAFLMLVSGIALIAAALRARDR